MEKAFQHKRVLVTGGCGFIGSHLALRCLKEGAQVFILDRPDNKCSDFLNKTVLNLTIKKISIVDIEKVADAILQIRPHYVFHLAASISRDRSAATLHDSYEINLFGTLNIIKPLLGDNNLIRFVHLGTMEEYGGGQAPFSESAKESPVSPYSLSKLCATRLVEYLAKEENFPAVVIRPSVVYGPKQGLGMFIPDLIKACVEKKDFPMSMGEQTRDFLFVTDLVDGLIKSALRIGIDGEIINIGSGEETSLKRVALFIRKIAGNPISINLGAIPYRRGENMHSWLDIAKARSLLSWKPTTKLENGLEETFNWYKDNWRKHE